MSTFYFRDYSDVPEVFSRIKSVASSTIVDQVKAIYLFDVAGSLPCRNPVCYSLIEVVELYLVFASLLALSSSRIVQVTTERLCIGRIWVCPQTPFIR